MPTTMRLAAALLSIAITAGCSTQAPRLPAVDDASRRPANAALALEALECRNELHNVRLSASEAADAAQRSRATLAGIAASMQTLSRLQPGTSPPRGNTVYTVRFAFGSAIVDMPVEAAAALVEDAKAAPLVVLRGRTDGITDSLAEIRVARDRAVAVRDFLVAAGTEPSRIRVTYQPTGDHVADNDGPTGKALNRRVEIEVYRALPMATGLRRAAN